MTFNTSNERSDALSKVFFLMLGIIALILPLFNVPLIQTSRSIIDIKILLVKVIGGICFILIGIRIISGKIQTFKVTPSGFFALCFLVWILFSAILSKRPLYSLQESLLLISFIVIFFSAQMALGSIESAKKIIFMIYIAGTIVFFIGFLQLIGLDILKAFLNYKYKGDIQGRGFFLSTIGNPEYVGSYLAILASLSLPAVLSKERSKKFYVKASCLILFILGLIMSGARGALIGFVCAIIAAIIISVSSGQWSPSRKLKIICVIALLLIIFILIILSFPNPLNVRNEFLFKRFQDLFDLRSESLSERIVFYCSAVEMTVRHPFFGGGAGSFKLEYFPTIAQMMNNDKKAGMMQFIYSSRNRSAEYAHCDYLQFLAEYGFPGFAFFIGFILSIIFSLTKFFKANSKSQKHSEEFFFKLSLLCAIICVLINSLFSFPLQMPIRGSLFWMLCGMSTASIDNAGNEDLREGDNKN